MIGASSSGFVGRVFIPLLAATVLCLGAPLPNSSSLGSTTLPILHRHSTRGEVWSLIAWPPKDDSLAFWVAFLAIVPAALLVLLSYLLWRITGGQKAK